MLEDYTESLVLLSYRVSKNKITRYDENIDSWNLKRQQAGSILGLLHFLGHLCTPKAQPSMGTTGKSLHAQAVAVSWYSSRLELTVQHHGTHLQHTVGRASSFKGHAKGVLHACKKISGSSALDKSLTPVHDPYLNGVKILKSI